MGVWNTPTCSSLMIRLKRRRMCSMLRGHSLSMSDRIIQCICWRRDKQADGWLFSQPPSSRRSGMTKLITLNRFPCVEIKRKGIKGNPLGSYGLTLVVYPWQLMCFCFQAHYSNFHNHILNIAVNLRLPLSYPFSAVASWEIPDNANHSQSSISEQERQAQLPGSTSAFEKDG